MDESQLVSQLDSQRRKVDVEHFDITIRELIRMAVDRELSIAPAYQRKFRWEEDAESKLIESIFLGLPVPSLFFASNKDGTWEVVDGLQRISSLIHFTGEKSDLANTIDKKRNLVLSNLEKLTTFNGLSFFELPQQIQLLFFKRSLRVTVLSDKSDYHVRFDMFERLNTGGVSLTPQEVRTCIFRGQLTDFLSESAKHETFTKLVKLQKGKQNDGTREEIVLKFFAYLNDYKEFDGRVTSFLNDFAAKWSKGFDEKKSSLLFQHAVDVVYQACGGPFIRQRTANTPLVQLEAVLVGVGMLLNGKKKIVIPKGRAWLEDEQLVSNSTGGSNTKVKLMGRIHRSMELFSGKA